MVTARTARAPTAIGSLDSLWDLRKQALALHDLGHSVQAIAEAVGLSRPAVYTALALAAAARRDRLSVPEALRPAPRGRRQGEGRLLSPRREEELRTLLLTRTPRQLGIDAATWTRATVRQLIGKRFLLRRDGEASVRFSLSDRAAGEYLSRWGLTGSITRRLDQKVALQAGETMVSAARLGELTLVWELLAWSLLSTGDLQELLMAYATEDWEGQSLFHTLARPGAFDRRRRHLMAHINHRLLMAQAEHQTSDELQSMRNTRQLLNSSAARVRERVRLLGTPAGPAVEHWSMRLVPITMVDVLVHRSKGGPALPSPRIHDGACELLLCMNWTTLHRKIERIGTDAARPSPLDRLDQLANAVRGAMGSVPRKVKSNALIHLPAVDPRRRGTQQLESVLDSMGHLIVRDGPPVFAWPANVILERHLVRSRRR